MNKVKMKNAETVSTKILMITTSIYLGLVGIGLTFLPQEIVKFLTAVADQTSILAFQILGALYLGFAMMNWMSKNSMIGGIYNRPLVFGNLLHFLISTFALIKIVGEFAGNRYIVMIIVTFFYSIFTICFGYFLLTSPINRKKTDK